MELARAIDMMNRVMMQMIKLISEIFHCVLYLQHSRTSFASCPPVNLALIPFFEGQSL